MTSTKLDPDALAALEDQRDFLLSSLDDLEREHDAGDLDDHDYETLRDDYTARAAEVLRSIEAQHDAMADARRPRNVARTLIVLGAVAAFAVLAGVLVAVSLGARGESDSASGGIGVRQSPSQRAQECMESMSMADPQPAIECFGAVLEDDPRNPVALTWFAWMNEIAVADAQPSTELLVLFGEIERMLDEAVESDPSYSYARAFRAVVAFRHGDSEAAKRYLDDFEANDPSTDAQAVIAQLGLREGIEAALAEQAEETDASGTDTSDAASTSTTAAG